VPRSGDGLNWSQISAAPRSTFTAEVFFAGPRMGRAVRRPGVSGPKVDCGENVLALWLKPGQRRCLIEPETKWRELSQALGSPEREPSRSIFGSIGIASAWCSRRSG
jgi:hypothetical protein